MGEYIHYGSRKFIKSAFIPIHNERCFTKPFGGLWASPIGAKYGWKDWCIANHFRDCRENNAFRFTLSKEANVIHIYSAKDLEQLPMQAERGTLSVRPDYEQILKNGVDAVELHLSEEPPHEWHKGLYYLLYGWDCDSIVILNPDIIVPLER